MVSRRVIDAELMEKNGDRFSRRHHKAADILRKADGKTDYKNIAKNLGIHETTVSSILRYAEKLGFATKKGEFYKKIPGVLKYIPRVKDKSKKRVKMAEIIKKINRQKNKFLTTEHEKYVTLNLKSQPKKMAEAYIWLYTTENVLRELIRNVLGTWEKRVNPGIKNDVQEAIKKYPYHGADRKDGLEFTHLGQLKEIITSKQNWNEFLPFLNEKNKNSFQVIIDKAIPSRNSIAHCTPLTPEDLKIIDVRFTDILKMIKT